MLVPALSFLQILGLYSLYLLYLGLPLLMKAPEERALVYTVVVIVVGMVIMAVISASRERSANFLSGDGDTVNG